MSSIEIRFILYSGIFLLSNHVAAQTEEPEDSVIPEARSLIFEALGDDGTELPPEGGKASIEGTPGDGIRDSFNYVINYRPTYVDEPGRIKLDVVVLDDETAAEIYRDTDFREVRTETIADLRTITGRIDLSYDTQAGQVLRFLGSLTYPWGRAKEFKHDLTVGCICPLEGKWTATNFPGTMVCTGAFNRTLPLAGNRQAGKLHVSDDCESVLVTKIGPEYADVPMQRVPGECRYEGQAHGIPNVLANTFKMNIQDENFIIGDLRMELVQSGATCVLTRDFEVHFDE